jgi:MATE family multidrug resistance protein
MDNKVGDINDTKNSSVLPDYGIKMSNEPTPYERQQQQQQQQQQQNQPKSSDYPGAVGGTPSQYQNIQGYDQNGNPIIPPFIAQRHQIEQSLGQTCPADGVGYHDLRMNWTNSTLLVSILIFPYCCGFRGRKEVKKEKKYNMCFIFKKYTNFF